MLSRKRLFSHSTYQRISRDDIELVETNPISSNCIALEGKLKKSELLLQEINTYLINSTTDVIIRVKPVFDEEKLKLIKLRGLLDRIYSRREDCDWGIRLNCETEFPEWNKLGLEVNSLIIKLEFIIQLELVQQRSTSMVISSNDNNNSNNNEKKQDFNPWCRKMIIILIVVLLLIIFILLWVMMKFGEVTPMTTLRGTELPTAVPSKSPTSVLPPLIKEQQLLAYFPLNGDTIDQSIYKNDGKEHGGLTYVPDRHGREKGAIHFDGSTSYIEIPGTKFHFQNDLTFSFWIQPDPMQTNDWATLFDKSVGSYTENLDGFTICQFSNSMNVYAMYYVPSIHMDRFSSKLFIPSNSWHHVVFVKRNGTIVIYFDGKVNSKMNNLTPFILINRLDLPLIIGARNTGHSFPATNLHYFYQGKLDDIFIYNRSLSAEEVEILYKFY